MSKDLDSVIASMRRRRLLQGAAALPLAGLAGLRPGPGPAVPHRQGQHHQAGDHRHRGHRRPAALEHRHHGHQRDRLDPGRAARHRPDQRHGRHPGPQDQGHQGRRRQRLAHLRREEQEAAGQRQGGRGLRLLDQRLAQGRAAGVREGERPAVLPHLLRRPGAEQERDLHRPGSHPADPLRPGLGAEGEEGQDLLPDRHPTTSGRAPR